MIPPDISVQSIFLEIRCSFLALRAWSCLSRQNLQPGPYSRCIRSSRFDPDAANIQTPKVFSDLLLSTWHRYFIYYFFHEAAAAEIALIFIFYQTSRYENTVKQFAPSDFHSAFHAGNYTRYYPAVKIETKKVTGEKILTMKIVLSAITAVKLSGLRPTTP